VRRRGAVAPWRRHRAAHQPDARGTKRRGCARTRCPRRSGSAPHGDALGQVGRLGRAALAAHTAHGGALAADTARNADKLTADQIVAEIQAHLIPGALLVPAGVGELVRLQDKGYRLVANA
jgi:hypothetical protein